MNNQLELKSNASKCPIEKTMNVIGGKWTFLILRDLFTGPKRFGEIQKSLKGVSPRTLSLRLKELHEEGIITRKIYSEIPPHVEYSLTDKGKTLRPIFEAMKEWGNTWDVLGIKERE
ncbi:MULTISPECIES: winged helix-turn-helix transcriptional regulator [Priestia]|uniref:winged helix-turn-helix transcriptional regulator n=1 Tax=Priestia TaxID=2800373 RepID=UPI00064FC6CD|nr:MULTISPECIES: helix-turn-helix domain-containing protein [Priestia]KML31434.1 HxlR family transcriptional regulator [Priestia aryabhattai]KMN93122.1 HxlR family transcriptional regulator [Priestia aryabhattai]QDZ81098.1 transcriptional regulator [Priestia megaterium]